LVSFNRKHNEANGEGNRDGAEDNRSWNCGAEGPSDDPAVNELRARQVRNFLVTLFFSQGVPMLLAGDEMGRTQAGNNNAYCQDNEVSWVDWSRAAEEQELTDFTCALSALRRKHPVFRRRRFFRDRPLASASDGLGDIAWLTRVGAEVAQDDWRDADARSLAVFLNGGAISEPGPRGERITDARFLLLFNAYQEPVTFVLPEVKFGPEWEIMIDTDGPRIPAIHGELPALAAKAEIEVAARSVIVLCCRVADAGSDMR
jgi:isoamylase